MTLAWSSGTATLAEDGTDRRSLGRWAGSLIAVALIHVVGAVTLLNWHAPVEPVEIAPPAIMIDLPPIPVPLPVPTPPPPPVFEPPKPPEPIQETIPEPKVVPPKPEVVLPPKPKPKPVQRKVEPQPPPPDVPPVAAPPRPPEPMAAPAPPVPATPAISPSYEGTLMAHLMRHQRYPREARMKHIEGVATIRFALTRDGKLLSFKLERSSGHKVLDEEVLAMIQRAAPMPPFPPEMAQVESEFSAPIRFQLR